MYNSYFGFSVSPFSVTPDPAFFYTNPVYREAYANLRYGIEGKKGFVVITGEVGTGKTTLLRKLMHNLKGTIHTVFIFNTYLNFTELLRVILHDLNLNPKEPDKVRLLQELNEYLIMRLKQEHIVSVLVDEAQNLSDEALEGLRLLSNLETDQEKLIQIVLMGQPELQTRLDQPSLRQLKQRVALQCRLVPLKAEEIAPYIDFRLRAAGYKGKDLFHPDAVREIAFYSKKLPRLVNIICDNSLLSAYAASQRFVSAEIIKEVARDLRLGSEVGKIPAETMPDAFVAKAEPERAGRQRMAPRHNLRRAAKAGVEIFLVVLALLAFASVIDPHRLLTNTQHGIEIAARNLQEWFSLVTHQQAVSAKASTALNVAPEVKFEHEVTFEPRRQRVAISRGSSVYKIASGTYGNNILLGIDLIKEFNPEIKNLNKVPAGRLLLLPPLTPEILLRKQPDGSYRFVIASFHSRTEADEYARRLRNDGYRVTIVPREVTEDLLLHRVEIDGLKTFEEASQLWRNGLKNQWPVAAGTPDEAR